MSISLYYITRSSKHGFFKALLCVWVLVGLEFSGGSSVCFESESHVAQARLNLCRLILQA